MGGPPPSPDPREDPDVRPVVGVSACLVGEAVRYDGRDKRSAVLVEDLARDVDLVPVCPEVEAGLGVPREPIRLEYAGGGVRVRGVASGTDVTAALTSAAARLVERLAAAGIDGLVLKEHSPSCALSGVPVHDAGGAARPLEPGRLAAALRARWPHLPAVPERDLEDAEARRGFLAAVVAHRRGRWERGVVRAVGPDEVERWCACPRERGDPDGEGWQAGERRRVERHHAHGQGLFAFEMDGAFLGKYDGPLRDEGGWTFHAPLVRDGPDADAVMAALCRHAAARARTQDAPCVAVILEEHHPHPGRARAALVAAGFAPMPAGLAHADGALPCTRSLFRLEGGTTRPR